MPAYISHAIMGNELYKNLINDSNIKTNINENKLRGFSIGADSAYLSKKVLTDPHNSYTQLFFLNMIEYIKNNNLIENENIISLLYGYIAHYFLDINIHPFVYYIEVGCQKVGLISNHNLVEGYHSAYLAQKILNTDIMEIKSNFFNQINLNDYNVKYLLNSIYEKIYGDNLIIEEYKKLLITFSTIENFIKSGLISKELLIKISQFIKFMEINNLSKEELTNENNEIFTNPVTGKKHNESLLELFNKSIDMSLEAIKCTNNYLYSNMPLSSLEKTFPDLSYDTGVSCSKGKKMIYVRK